jgi:hypothetical protein
MNTRAIYRIENKEGIGPYCNRFVYPDETEEHENMRNLISKIGYTHSSCDTHPGKGEDFTRSIADDKSYYLACQTFDKLKEWFDEFLEVLLKTGYFNVVEYVVPENSLISGYSGRQCVFNKELAVDKKIINLVKTEAGTFVPDFNIF